MLRRSARFLAAIGMACAMQAQALGLGEIEVRSKLNQRFSASIPVLDATAQDLESLQVVLATTADFERSGIERADYLSSLTLQLVSGAGGTRVQLSSPQINHEPFLDFLVDARWQGGRLQREYTVLFDPASLASASPAKPATAAVEPAAAPIAPPPESTDTASKPAAADVSAPAAASDAGIDEAATGGVTSSRTYGPVDAAETLWRIAAKLKPEQATTDQMLVALYQANPRAFSHRRFDGLMRGATLNVPAEDQIEAISPRIAAVRIAQLRRGETAAGESAAAAVPTKQAKAAPAAAEPAASTSETPPHPAPETTVAGPAAASPSTAEATPAAPASSAPAAAVPAAPAGPAASPSPSIAATAGEPAATPVEPVTAPPPSAPEAPAVHPPALAAPRASLIDRFTLPLLAIVAALFGGFVGWRMMRGRQAARSAASPAPIQRPPMVPASTAPKTAQVLESARSDHKTVAAVEPAKAAALSAAVPPKSPPPVAAAAPARTAEADLAAQLQAQTVAVDLEANDPLSEADFHLAYGLYDEAAALLRRGLEKEPARKDLRIKLAETYFGAGKAPEFQQTALALRGQIPAEDWQRLAEMGRQIAPDVGAFKEDAESAPAAPVSEPAPEAPAAISPPPIRAPLEFKLDEPPATAPPPAEPLAVAPSNLIEFDLDTELSNLAQQPAAVAPAAKPAPAAAEPTVEFKLDDPDAGPSLPERKLHAWQDELNTKLDLARAYADMGDNDAAAGLLNEVIAGGNSAQKQAADDLAKRLRTA